MYLGSRNAQHRGTGNNVSVYIVISDEFIGIDNETWELSGDANATEVANGSQTFEAETIRIWCSW